MNKVTKEELASLFGYIQDEKNFAVIANEVAESETYFRSAMQLEFATRLGNGMFENFCKIMLNTEAPVIECEEWEDFGDKLGEILDGVDYEKPVYGMVMEYVHYIEMFAYAEHHLKIEAEIASLVA